MTTQNNLGTVNHQQLDGTSLANSNIKRQDSFNSLASIDDKQVSLDPNVLFTRLTAIAEREDDEEEYVKFDMSLYPPSIFKETCMRKPDKPTLRKVLQKDEDIANVDSVVPSSYVLDSGALLDQVRWFKGFPFKDLAQIYVSYVCCHYKTATIVFDGYNNPLSKKTNAYTRRSPINCRDVVFNESILFKRGFSPVKTTRQVL